jgi:hypothetical protein
MRRRPPFALVLVAFVGALAAVIGLTSTGGGGSTGTNPALPASGPARTCVTARAEAVATATKTLRAPVEARIPVSVTERGHGVAVTVGEEVVERAVATRVVEARRAAIARRRACATSPTPDAARSAALTRAYKKALQAARVRARALVTAGVQAFAAQELPALAASAQREVDARAQSAAAADRQTLASRAKAKLG